MAAATNFKVFYTKHKNRKHKVWQDGFLKLAVHGLNMHKIYLFDFEEHEIDCTYISKKVIVAEGTELESQHYLIIIEETMNLKAPKSPPGRVQSSLSDSSWTKGSNVCESDESYPEGNESVNRKRSIRDIMELITNDNKRTKPRNEIKKGEDVFQSEQGKLEIDNSKVYKENILEPPKCNFWIPNISPGKKMVKGQSRWSSFLHPPSPPPLKPWSLLTEKVPESSHKRLTTTSHLCVQPSLNQQSPPHSLFSPSSPILPLSSSHSGISTFDSITNTSEGSLFISSGEEPPFVDQCKPKASDSLIRFLKPRIAIAEEHVLISPSRSLFLHPPIITHSSSAGYSSQPQSPSLHYATKPATTPAAITSSTAPPLNSPVVLSSKGEIGYCTDAVSDYDVFDATGGAVPTVCQEVPFPLSRMKDVRSRDCFKEISLSRESITITVDDEVHPDRMLGKINTAQTFSLGNDKTLTALAPVYHQTKTIPFKDDDKQSITKSSTSCSMKPFCYDNSKPNPYPWQPGGVEALFGSFPMQPGDSLSTTITYNKKDMPHSPHLAPHKLLPCQRGSSTECFSKKVIGQVEIINPVRGSEYRVNTTPVPHTNSTHPTINRISNDSFAIEDLTINCHSVSSLSPPPLLSSADSVRAGLNSTTQHSIQNEVKSMAQNNDSHSTTPSSTGSNKGNNSRYKFILSDPKIDDISLIKKNPEHFKLGLWDI